MNRLRDGAGRAAMGDRPDRAVIDIGSNTVRLVVYSGSRRAPGIWLNEKVTAKLGRELATTGRIPDKAMDLALAGLARFAAILTDIGVADVQTVATAAARDAENGQEFLGRVRNLGLEPRLLSGLEEADYSAIWPTAALRMSPARSAQSRILAEAVLNWWQSAKANVTADAVFRWEHCACRACATRAMRRSKKPSPKCWIGRNGPGRGATRFIWSAVHGAHWRPLPNIAANIRCQTRRLTGSTVTRQIKPLANWRAWNRTG